jgi:hypothetical protein
MKTSHFLSDVTGQEFFLSVVSNFELFLFVVLQNNGRRYVTNNISITRPKLQKAKYILGLCIKN